MVSNIAADAELLEVVDSEDEGQAVAAASSEGAGVSGVSQRADEVEPPDSDEELCTCMADRRPLLRARPPMPLGLAAVSQKLSTAAPVLISAQESLVKSVRAQAKRKVGQAKKQKKKGSKAVVEGTEEAKRRGVQGGVDV